MLVHQQPTCSMYARLAADDFAHSLKIGKRTGSPMDHPRGRRLQIRISLRRMSDDQWTAPDNMSTSSCSTCCVRLLNDLELAKRQYKGVLVSWKSVRWHRFYSVIHLARLAAISVCMERLRGLMNAEMSPNTSA